MAIAVTPFTGPDEEWDRFVRAQPGWTHFHLAGWRRIYQRVFGHECLYMAGRREDGKTGSGTDGQADGTGELRSPSRLSAVLPLVRVRSRLFGHYLVSLPYVNYGGPLGDAESVRALVDRAVEIARADGVKLLELRSRHELPLDLPVSHRKVTVVLDLPKEDPEPLWKSFPAKVRSQVRRPTKEGVTVRFGPDQVEPFYAVFAHHMRDLGTPVLPRRFFEAVAAEFPESAWFGCAWLGERPIACGAGFVWNGEFEMTWASALSEYNRIAPNMLLYWSFMERAVKAGLGTFNFGRCTPEGGTHRFKKQWGSRDEPLWWYQRTPTGEPASTPSPDDGAYSWGPRLWKKLPVSLATMIGPRIVRGIP
ncbi:MAG TPA: GNAT family N-acetyltransferase [Gemmatimonadales bacterium]|nr:GNAT family N-acetyltransferase [Gemmatimonadales bacterium]